MGQELDQVDHGKSAEDQPRPATGATSWRDSKWLALGEIGVVVLIFIADAKGYIKFSKTPYLFLFAWMSLWLRRKRWKDVGLKRFHNWRTTLGYGTAAGIGLELFQLLVSQPLLVWLTGKQPDLENFRELTGNPKLFLLYLPLLWVLAAFGEEAVYRGYLMNREADLGNQTRTAWVASLIVVYIFFGLAHSYQGITGIIDEGLMGLLLGLIYLGCGRNLCVPIIAHGVQDTIDMVLVFLGKYPGM